ncbi:Hypothetical predicted protein, partial [Olea europaea subsp. europaea]
RGGDGVRTYYLHEGWRWSQWWKEMACGGVWVLQQRVALGQQQAGLSGFLTMSFLVMDGAGCWEDDPATPWPPLSLYI